MAVSSSSAASWLGIPSAPESSAYVINTSSDSESEADTDVKVIASRRHALREKIIKTVILYTGVLFLGLQWGVIGPSLPDLELVTRSSTTFIALILTGRNVASLAGSALAGVLIDKYNNWLLLGCAELSLGLLFAIAPWGGHLVLLAMCLIPSGVAAGFYDTGVNVAVLDVWISKPGPWIQAMECVDAIGSFAAPLLVQPFLLPRPTNPLLANGRSNYTVTGDDDQSRTTAGSNATSAVNGSHAEENGIFVQQPPGRASSVGLAYLIVGLLLICTAGAHFFVFCSEPCRVRVRRDSSSRKAPAPAEARGRRDERSSRLLLLPLLFAICFAYYALETGYAHYLMTFCVRELRWTKDRGVAVASAFWGSYTAGTAVGVAVIGRVRPRTLLACDVALCLASQLALVLAVAAHPAAVWPCTVAAGLGVSTIFASVFSWTQKNIGVSGKVNALLMVAVATGEMTSPAIIGVLMDSGGAISWAYCMLASASLCAAAFVLMHVVAGRLKAIRARTAREPSGPAENKSAPVTSESAKTN